MFLFHLLNDLCEVFPSEQVFDSFFVTLPLLYWDRTTSRGHCEKPTESHSLTPNHNVGE
jgi:hypothetical protein